MPGKRRYLMIWAVVYVRLDVVFASFGPSTLQGISRVRETWNSEKRDRIQRIRFMFAQT